jgi:hypothetical protein
MKLLLSTLTPAYLRNFDPVLRLLAERGHDVHLAVHNPTKAPKADDLAHQLSADQARITTDRAPAPRDDYHHLAMSLRACRDYLQFASPAYNERYRARTEERVPPPFRRLADHRFARRAAVRAALRRALPAAERAVPPSPAALEYLQRHAPDVVAFTPYVGLRTVQPDYLSAARALGIRTAVWVASWDNLSSKSLLRPEPDLVVVWNETQRAEAEALHGIAPEHVAVTGAQCFDHWFGWPPRPRAEFCREAGLDPERPYLLYTCFSPFKGQEQETGFVREWLAQLRASSHGALREVGVLIRPHPKRGAQWRDVDLSEFGPVTVWPKEGAMVVDFPSRADFYDSIHHSAGVVGLNTSAMIEAGIAERPVHTLLVPRFWESQEGTLHFRYLMQVGGGLLQVARAWDDHLAQLAASVAARGSPYLPARAFVESFVRPHGLDTAATPLFVDALERLAAAPATTRPRAAALDRAMRLATAVPARYAAGARSREADRRKARKKAVTSP